MAAPNNRMIKVTFLHPRDPRGLDAEVGPAMTAQQAIAELVKAEFIPPPQGEATYVLTHTKTSKPIPANKSLVESGVEAGDTVQVTAIGVSGRG